MKEGTDRGSGDHEGVKKILSPELAHRLMQSELRRSGARLNTKDAWVASLANEKFFQTLLKLSTEEQCLSESPTYRPSMPDVLKYERV